MTIKMLLPLLEFKKANMSERRVDGFLYGLFMDVAVLGKSGVIPVNPRRAYVNAFALRIGNALFQFELDRQLHAAGHGRPVRRGVWPVVSRTGCCDSHSGLIQRLHSRRVEDRRVLLESSRFIDADMHSHAVS